METSASFLQRRRGGGETQGPRQIRGVQLEGGRQGDRDLGNRLRRRRQDVQVPALRKRYCVWWSSSRCRKKSRDVCVRRELRERKVVAIDQQPRRCEADLPPYHDGHRTRGTSRSLESEYWGQWLFPWGGSWTPTTAGIVAKKRVMILIPESFRPLLLIF